MTQLNIFLVREKVVDPNDIIHDRDSLETVDVRDKGKSLGILYVKKSVPTAPSWLSFFAPNAELDALKLRASSVASVLLVKAEQRIFALTFGFGRFLLNVDALDSRFGLRVTLNSVEPSKLRSIDHQRLDGVPRHTREQLSKAETIGHFGLNVERDLLRSLTGQPRDPALGKRMSGGDSLSLVGGVTLSTLRDKLARLLEISGKTDYRNDFAWVDNIAEVRDRALIDRLETRLATEVKKRSPGISLAVPEPVDWANVVGYAYSNRKSADTLDELELGSFLDSLHTSATIDELRKQRIWLVGADEGRAHRHFQAYRCLLAELRFNSQHFVLSNGKWYQIDKDLEQKLADDIAAIELSKHKLPDALVTETEEVYNARAATALPTQLCLLDQNFVQYPKRSKIEVCDLYHRERALIHVKRFRQSASLSHLFLQSTVSAELLIGDPRFRTEFFKKLPPPFPWGTQPDPLIAGDFEVCLAVIGDKCGASSLPFFSRLGLRNTVANLKRLGFRPTYSSVGLI